jgi:glycosyltransferase involved in cell wall biosynthesis
MNAIVPLTLTCSSSIKFMSKPLSILLLYNRIPYPLTDGGSIAMYQLLESLKEAKVDIHIMMMNTPKHWQNEKKLPKIFKQVHTCTIVPINTAVTKWGIIKNLLFSNLPEHADRFYNKTFERKLNETISTVQPDFILLESIFLASYTKSIKNISKAKIIIRSHNIEFDIWGKLARSSNNLFKKWYLNILSNRLEKFEITTWSNADAVLPITTADANTIVKYIPKSKTHFLPVGISIKTPLENKSEIPLHFIAYHVGAMDWQPNIDAMLWMKNEIIPAILKVDANFKFEFGGRAMPKSFKMEKENHFYCKGFIENMHQFTQDKQVLMVPLRVGSGVRIKTLEAMGLGKIVISTSVGIAGINAIDKVHYIKANNANEFANAWKWIIEHPIDAKKIAANAFQLIQDSYNSKKIATDLVSYLQQLSIIHNN